MKELTNENLILKIIRYFPLLFTILMAIIATSYISFNYANDLKIEKEKIQKEYIEQNKSIIQTNIDAVHNYINNKNQMSTMLLKKEIKDYAYYAHIIMTSIYNKYKDTKTKEEITTLIKTVLENLKLNEGKGYYFIYDIHGTAIFHPINHKREGKNFFNFQDKNGNFIVQESINIAKSQKEEGYQTWMFVKPNGLLKEYEKIGFIKKFKPYNWLIGIGEYTDNFNKKVKKEILEHIKDLRYRDTGNIFVIDKKEDFLITRTKYSNIKDINKKNAFINSFTDFVNSEKDEVFIEYDFLKANTNYSEKISYLKKVKIYDWVIGSGFNLDNLNLKIKEKQKELEKNYDKDIYSTLIIAFIMTTIFLFISMYISSILKNKFLDYKQNLEKQLTKNKKQKDTLLRAQEVAHIGDWELNIKANRFFWSDEIIRIFGLNKKKKINYSPEFLKNIMIKEDISNFEYSLNNCIKKGIEHRTIYRIKRPDNTIRWIECRGILNKDKLSILGTIQDITDSKNLEIEKQEKEEILYQQSKMAAMGEMIGNIAHQWRQPLSVISTSATGAKVQKEMNCLSDKDLYSSLTTINTSAQYLSSTIEDFKDFFNPGNNKISKFSIFNSFEKVLNLVKSQFDSKNIEVIKNIEDFELSSIENELIQVLINILNNARDALLEKQNQKRLIFINAYIKNNISYIEILDNAGGIKEDIKNRIFEPYFTTKYKSQGTGIGLYMSKDIIEKHLNGVLLVTNEDYIFEDISYIGAKFTIKISDNLEIL